jgi:transposase
MSRFRCFGCLSLLTRGMTANGVISDQMWVWMEPLLPSTKGKRGGRFRDHRLVIEGIAYKYRTGVPWRDVPARFGPWQTLHWRHNAWSNDGTWQRLLRAAQARADADGELDWLTSADSSLVRAHQHAAGARPVRGGSVESHDPPGRAA